MKGLMKSTKCSSYQSILKDINATLEQINEFLNGPMKPFYKKWNPSEIKQTLKHLNGILTQLREFVNGIHGTF